MKFKLRIWKIMKSSENDEMLHAVQSCKSLNNLQDIWFHRFSYIERVNAIEKYAESYWFKELYDLKSHDYIPYKISLKHLLNNYS